MVNKITKYGIGMQVAQFSLIILAIGIFFLAKISWTANLVVAATTIALIVLFNVLSLILIGWGILEDRRNNPKPKRKKKPKKVKRQRKRVRKINKMIREKEDKMANTETVAEPVAVAQAPKPVPAVAEPVAVKPAKFELMKKWVPKIKPIPRKEKVKVQINPEAERAIIEGAE